MGALIQTKGTQRLAKLFNDRFDGSGTGITFARGVQSTIAPLTKAFENGSNDLLQLSDMLIAQNAVQGHWPADGNDFLYPSATMTTSAATAGATTLDFTLPATINTVPGYIAPGAAVCSLDRKSIPRGTIVANNGVSAVTGGAGGTFTVTLSTNVTVNAGEKISFAKGNNQQLVRRWRWYLKNDLQSANHDAIRRAIFQALDDPNFQKITFQTIEDKQRVLINIETQLNNNFEFDDPCFMHIILLTQQTTSPDPLDPQ
jgi:hypothetical protein